MPAFKTFFWSWIFAASPSVFIFFVKQAGNPPIHPRVNQFKIMNPSCCLQFYPSGFVRSLLGCSQVRVLDVPRKGEIQRNNKSRSLIHFCHRVAMTSLLPRTFRGKFRRWCKWKFRASEGANFPVMPPHFPGVLFITQSFFFSASREATTTTTTTTKTTSGISVLVYAGVQ